MNTSSSSGSSVQSIKTVFLLLGFLCAGALAGQAALPNATVSNKTYTSGTVTTEAADQTIGTSGTVQVSSGAQTTFNAGTKITLSPGFTAQAGSTFHTGLVGAPADVNADGVPDYWLIQYGYSTTTPATQLDANGSGQTLLQDYLAGINPLPITISYEVRYDLNQRNQVTALKDSTNAVFATYTYNVDATRQSRWLKNNTQADYAYDGAERMISLNNYVVSGSSEIQKQEYGYDLRDRRVWTQRDGNLGDTYTYQADSELIDFKLNAANPRTTPTGWTQEVAYAYDAMGNRTSVTDNGAVTSYGVDHANQYTSVTGATIQYGDGRGNVTQWNAWTYTYDADNRMLSATKAGTAVTFAYDPAGRLAKRTTNGQVEYFTYDGVQQLVRVDQNGSQLSSTIWGTNPDEVLIDTTPQSGNRYFHSDIQGTSLAVTNDSHQILERYRYDPYGNTSFYDANWSQRSDTAYDIRFLYTGQERMSAVGSLYNYKNRFYSAELGRFFQTDPIRFDSGDINLYRYCDNDPFDRQDPLGLFNTFGHNSLFNSALGNTVPNEDLASMKQGSALEDKETGMGTTADEVSQHSMMNTEETVGEAKQRIQESVNEKVKDAAKAEVAGNHKAAMILFGRAAHTVQDGFSPAHVAKNGNPKIWHGLKGPANLARAAAHALHEIWPTSAARAKSNAATQKLFEKFKQEVNTLKENVPANAAKSRS